MHKVVVLFFLILIILKSKIREFTSMWGSHEFECASHVSSECLWRESSSIHQISKGSVTQLTLVIECLTNLLSQCEK